LPRRSGLILIVDDSLHTREMYSDYLTHRGLAVVTAPDAQAGLELALAVRPDVIVMDLALPGLDGITATQRLKRDPRTRRIPVVVLTGYAFRAIQQGALEAGADAFLTKPCLPEDLEARLRDLLPGRPA
jgi:two-component system cell cycle response regulator DivK